MDISKTEIEKLCINEQATLKTALYAINVGKERILFVVNEDLCLRGALSDGDLRRALINGFGFDASVAGIMNKSPHVIRKTDPERDKKLFKFFSVDKLETVPMVDEAGRIVDVFFWRDILDNHPLAELEKERFSNPVVIMAGGKGTRMDPFTKILPKPLIPLIDKPIVEKIMDQFYKCGFDNFILTLNYRKEAIKMYFRENAVPYKVDWIEEKEFLGTAGSLKLLRRKIKEPFFVCNCDILIEHNIANIMRWHRDSGAAMTLVGAHKETVLPYGVLHVKEGQLSRFEEKPRYDMIINTGFYVLSPEVFNIVKWSGYLDMDSLIEQVKAKNKVMVYPIFGGWFDVGQWEEYRKSVELLTQQRMI